MKLDFFFQFQVLSTFISIRFDLYFFFQFQFLSTFISIIFHPHYFNKLEKN